MITENQNSNMGSEVEIRSTNYSEELVGKDSGFDIFRSPSAPPTVEGGGKRDISDEELRSDPNYVNYYYSNVNLNPRLPPPLLSKEDWRFSQRVSGSGGGLGGIGDRRRGNGRDEFGNNPSYSSNSLFSNENEWSGVGLPGLGLGNTQKSIAEIIQDDLGHSASTTRIPSRPAGHNAFDETIVTSEPQFGTLSSTDTSGAGGNFQSNIANHNTSVSSSLTYASALGGSLSRSTTPDPHLIARSPSPRIPTVSENRINSMDKRSSTSLYGTSNGPSSNADLAAALSGMSLSSDSHLDEEKQMGQNFHHGIGDRQNHYTSHGDPEYVKQNYYSRANGFVENHKRGGGPNSPNFHSIGNPNSGIPNYSLSGHNINPGLASMMAGQLGSGALPPLFENAAASAMGVGGNAASRASLMADLQNLQMSQIDPMYLQLLPSSDYTAPQMAALNDPSIDGGNSYMESLAFQKAYLSVLLSQQKSECGRPYLGKASGLTHGYYGNPAYGINTGYGGNAFANSLLPNSPGSHLRYGERNMRMSSGMRNLPEDVMGNWRSEGGGFMEQSFGSSLLDEFKSNKSNCFELAEIEGFVVEFSADQYGSRFIQQKLETATPDEKNMVFNEIIPHALSLMTDVFGNYVIQKFFEHGSPSQIRELAVKLTGHVLKLSLQMYGCRVIQKAIEVVDLDQQKKMVVELDSQIMRCVRDQNGNHVIQKCIECIPEDSIQFIISTFYDQVVTLSTHPYGCRVIQRVLEHCRDPTTQRIVMDEIMQSVSMLAQDQYGNYVVQHVLEHGKPHERSAIIVKLTGNIVQMSQQKFASNVIEKCLSFGNETERCAIVNEMLGSTDENEPLQAMMKDQFANYVVQKVLETCDDQQLEVILSRIKNHLTALKKYTYGKHIVARVEKLVAAGERRISLQLQSQCLPPMA